MQIDVVTIFPEYFSVLGLSLLGKARDTGLITTAVHDLRDFTTDRHRSVDDTPYGGGAGMVMRPEPWGNALDQLLQPQPQSPEVSPALGAGGPAPVVVFPSPAGERFSQPIAAELAGCPRLIFCCGRYEGIDQRVIDHAATRAVMREISLGDYVLNGGEVAALAMIEAVGRLLPGVLGNPASLVEESHQGSLLEHPSYTKPASWRGLDVPAVLLSGHHAEIAQWRRQQQRERTARVRPDLLGPGPQPPTPQE